MIVLIVFMAIELLLMLLTGRLFILISGLLFYLNKKTIRKGWVCWLTAMYDWEYYTKKHETGMKRHPVIEVTHRKCAISGKEQIECLPRCNGYSTWKTIKST